MAVAVSASLGMPPADVARGACQVEGASQGLLIVAGALQCWACTVPLPIRPGRTRTRTWSGLSLPASVSCKPRGGGKGHCSTVWAEHRPRPAGVQLTKSNGMKPSCAHGWCCSWRSAHAACIEAPVDGVGADAGVAPAALPPDAPPATSILRACCAPRRENTPPGAAAAPATKAAAAGCVGPGAGPPPSPSGAGTAEPPSAIGPAAITWWASGRHAYPAVGGCNDPHGSGSRPTAPSMPGHCASHCPALANAAPAATAATAASSIGPHAGPLRSAASPQCSARGHWGSAGRGFRSNSPSCRVGAASGYALQLRRPS
jgi:hypothetical protein